MLPRLLLIGLTPLVLAALGMVFSGHWAVLLALVGIGIVLASAMYRFAVIRPMRAAADASLKLLQRQTLLQAVLDNAPMAIAIKDVDGHYLISNAGHQRQYGLTEQQILGKTDADLVPPAMARGFRDSDLKVMETGETLTYWTPLQNPGQWRQMETVKYPLRGPHGQVIGVGFVASDVTELAASQEKLSRVFHTSPDWIVITRLADNVVVDANEGFERISGHARSTAIGRPMGELQVWLHPEQRAAIIEQLLRTGAVRDAMVQMRRRDGQVRDCIVSATLITLEGRENSHAVWVTRDVTLEHAVHEQFVAAFRLTPDFMSISRLSDGTYVEVNEAFERSTGYGRDETIGRTSQELGIWHKPAQRQELINAFQGCDVVREFPMEMRNRHGQVRETLLNASIFEARGERYMIGLLRDVTDAKRAQQEILALNARLEDRVLERTRQLQDANAELSLTLATLSQAKDQLVQSEKLAALGALVAGVAHELNTPIGNGLTVASALEHKVREFAATTTQGLTRAVLEQFVSDTQLAGDILVRNLTRAATLVTSFKQVAVDRTSSQRRPFDLKELVAEIVVMLDPVISLSACRVLPRIEPGLVLDSYPGPLGQVLINLINNAMLHGFEPDQRGTIEISASALDAQRVQLRVRDSGRGIEPGHLKRIFEPFFTTRLGQGGSGLGLHIVHNLVTRVLGGVIEAHEVAGGGADFVLQLPVTAPAAQQDD